MCTKSIFNFMHGWSLINCKFKPQKTTPQLIPLKNATFTCHKLNISQEKKNKQYSNNVQNMHVHIHFSEKKENYPLCGFPKLECQTSFWASIVSVLVFLLFFYETVLVFLPPGLFNHSHQMARN